MPVFRLSGQSRFVVETALPRIKAATPPAQIRRQQTAHSGLSLAADKAKQADDSIMIGSAHRQIVENCHHQNLWLMRRWVGL